MISSESLNVGTLAGRETQAECRSTEGETTDDFEGLVHECEWRTEKLQGQRVRKLLFQNRGKAQGCKLDTTNLAIFYVRVKTLQ